MLSLVWLAVGVLAWQSEVQKKAFQKQNHKRQFLAAKLHVIDHAFNTESSYLQHPSTSTDAEVFQDLPAYHDYHSGTSMPRPQSYGAVSAQP